MAQTKSVLQEFSQQAAGINGEALVIEDDPVAAGEVARHLAELGISTVHASSGAEGLRLALSKDWRLVVADLNLPALNGADLCRELRRAKPQQVIVVLTANSDVAVTVRAFELGADEFLRKPFHGPELRARISALLRRAGQQLNEAEISVTEGNRPHSFVFGDVMIDQLRYRVTYRERAIALTPTEFDLLRLLATHPERVFSREEIVTTLWEASPEVYSLNIRFHINNIRTKFAKAGVKRAVINTSRGFGYRFSYADELQ